MGGGVSEKPSRPWLALDSIEVSGTACSLRGWQGSGLVVACYLMRCRAEKR